MVSNLPHGGGRGHGARRLDWGAYQSVQLYDQGAIRPVDDVIAELKKSGEFDDFQPGSIDTLRYNDHYVALPWAADIRVWYYRKDLLEAAHQQPPTNWDEFAKVAKATTGNGKYGLVDSGDTGGSQIIYTVILNNGGGLFSPDRKLALMSDRNVEAVTALANMVKDGSVSPASAGYSYDDARSAFQRGEAAFMLDTPGAIDSAPDAVKPKIGILPPPTTPHGDKGTVYWINNIMIYTQSKHPEEDKAFMLWWSKNQKPLWTKGHSTELPIRKSIAIDPYFVDNPATAQIIKEYIPVGKTTATAAKGIFPSLNDLEGEGTFQSFVQQLWQGKPVPDMFSTAETSTEGRPQGVATDGSPAREQGRSQSLAFRQILDRPDRATPYLLLAPSGIMIAAIVIYPMALGFYYGLTDGTLLRPGSFVGLRNYWTLIGSADFRNALEFSFVFAIFNVAGCYFLGLGLAILLNLDLPGQGFFRTALLLPWIVPSIVAIVSWRWMLADERAFFNSLITTFGGSPIFFLSDSHWAVASVIVIKIWRSFPFMMLSLLAALQGIDRSLYEAAEIDGASHWQAFLYMTMPQLKNISIVLCLLMTIWTVNDFDTPWLLTQGGPASATENLILLAYRYTFGRNNVGMGSATSFITLLILMILVIFLLRRRSEP